MHGRIFTQVLSKMQETLAWNFSYVYIRGKLTPNTQSKGGSLGNGCQDEKMTR